MLDPMEASVNAWDAVHNWTKVQFADDAAKGVGGSELTLIAPARPNPRPGGCK
jgi:hypothetical protein